MEHIEEIEHKAIITIQTDETLTTSQEDNVSIKTKKPRIKKELSMKDIKEMEVSKISIESVLDTNKIENIDKPEIKETDSIKLIERFDEAKLWYIYDHYEELMSKMKVEEKSSKNQDDEKKWIENQKIMIKRYLEKSVRGYIEIEYYQNNKKGRFYCKDGIGQQAMSRIIRHTISGEYNIDIDIVNCAPSILVNIMNEINNDITPEERIHFPYLTEYYKNREKCLVDIQKEGVDKSKVKTLIISFIFGGKIKKEDNIKSSFLFNLQKEIEEIIQFLIKYKKDEYDNAIKDVNEKYVKKIESKKKELGDKFTKEEESKIIKKNPIGRFMSVYLIFDKENIILQSVNELLKLKNIQVLLWQFDGNCIDKKQAMFDLLQECSEYVKTKTKYDISFAYKYLDENINIDNTVLEEYKKKVQQRWSIDCDELDDLIKGIKMNVLVKKKENKQIIIDAIFNIYETNDWNLERRDVLIHYLLKKNKEIYNKKEVNEFLKNKKTTNPLCYFNDIEKIVNDDLKEKNEKQQLKKLFEQEKAKLIEKEKICGQIQNSFTLKEHNGFNTGDIIIEWDKLSEYDFARTLNKLIFKNKLIFTEHNKKTTGFMFNDVYWEIIDDINYLKKDNMEKLYIYYSKKIIEDKDKITNELLKECKKKIDSLTTSQTRNNVLRILIDEKYIPKSKIEWNKNKELFVFEDCVYDLEKGQFVEARMEDYITETCGYSFKEYIDKNMDEEKEVIHKFMDSIIREKTREEEKRYILKLLASFLVQRNKEEEGYFILGKGGNGKGTLTKILMNAFGKYFGELDVAYYTNYEKGTNSPNQNLYDSALKRVLNTSEINEEDAFGNKTKFITDKFKKITGRDKIHGRAVHSQDDRFYEAGKILIQLNTLPSFTMIDNAIKRRVVIITLPYNFVKTQEEVDKDPTKYKLRDETLKDKFESVEYRVAFIKVLFEYYELYKKEGLTQPQSIRDNLSNYIVSESFIENWFTSNFVYDEEAEHIKLSDLCRIFKVQNDIPKCSIERFKKCLENIENVEDNIKYLHGYYMLKNFKYVEYEKKN